jgi:hypothetical protein
MIAFRYSLSGPADAEEYVPGLHAVQAVIPLFPYQYGEDDPAASKENQEGGR